MDTQALNDDIAAFQKAHGVKDSTFGRLALNDWKLVRDLRAGNRRLWPETEAKVRRFMSTYTGKEKMS